MRKFFINSDDFFYIISSQVQKIKRVERISTGWTNFVFKVKARGGEYIFRFPRNDFFSTKLEKECAFLAGICRRKISVALPEIKLCSFKGRSYSVHKSLAGKPLADCSLSAKKLKKVALSALQFLDEFAQIFPRFSLSTTSQFLRELSLVGGGEYDISKHEVLEKEEKLGVVLSHGDFNPGNILIKHGKICGVLDFAFVSYSTPLDDVARIVGRYPQIARPMFDELKKRGAPDNIEERVAALCQMWKYVEEKYIEYIKRKHPDIILPEN